MESSDVRFHSWRDKGILILTGRTPVIFKDWLLQKRPGWGEGVKIVLGARPLKYHFFQDHPGFFFFFNISYIFAIKPGNKALKPDCASFFVYTCFALSGNVCAFWWLLTQSYKFYIHIFFFFSLCLQLHFFFFFLCMCVCVYVCVCLIADKIAIFPGFWLACLRMNEIISKSYYQPQPKHSFPTPSKYAKKID